MLYYVLPHGIYPLMNDLYNEYAIKLTEYSFV